MPPRREGRPHIHRISIHGFACACLPSCRWRTVYRTRRAWWRRLPSPHCLHLLPVHLCNHSPPAFHTSHFFYTPHCWQTARLCLLSHLRRAHATLHCHTTPAHLPAACTLRHLPLASPLSLPATCGAPPQPIACLFIRQPASHISRMTDVLRFARWPLPPLRFATP